MIQKHMKGYLCSKKYSKLLDRKRIDIKIDKMADYFDGVRNTCAYDLQIKLAYQFRYKKKMEAQAKAKA